MPTKLTRLELSFDDAALIGAQATFVDTGEINGQPVTLPPRTTGLDCGQNPEYATTLEDALGTALSEAVAANAVLTAELTVAREQLAALTENAA